MGQHLQGLPGRVYDRVQANGGHNRQGKKVNNCIEALKNLKKKNVKNNKGEIPHIPRTFGVSCTFVGL